MDDEPTDPQGASGARRSRAISVGILGAVAVIVAVVLATSQANGPASDQPAAAAGGTQRECPPTQTMPGGDNGYTQGAPRKPDLGTGFVVSGTVREAGSCAPVADTRVQIWLDTARGPEGHPSNKASVWTDKAGRYRLETSPIVPQFGQYHVHLAYDDGAYAPLFLRWVLPDEDADSVRVDFNLRPRGER